MRYSDIASSGIYFDPIPDTSVVLLPLFSIFLVVGVVLG